MARRIRITVAYDGTDFHGWQLQPALPTIQGTIEEIVAGIEGKAVRVEASGRTDAGVHALAQVAAFTLENPIPPDNLRRAMNRLLPASVRVCQVEDTHAGFHPRFDAVAKTYRYTIFREEVCPPTEWRYVYHHPYPLNEGAMVKAAAVYAGEHDFSAFAAADHRDVVTSKVRTIFNSVVERQGDRLIYTVRGNGFLKHMVRNIVGTLLEAGRGNIDGGKISGEVGPDGARQGFDDGIGGIRACEFRSSVSLNEVPCLYDIEPGPYSPEIVRMIVEIPQHSANKYEYDGELGVFRLDRALFSPMHYPGDYGFIPGTLAEDNDPLDCLVLVQQPSYPGVMIEVRPVGVLDMVDAEEGDQKILAVPTKNPRYDQIHTMDQIFAHVRREIEHFFTIYKELEGRTTRMEGWGGPMEARRAIVESRQRYLDRKAAAAKV